MNLFLDDMRYAARRLWQRPAFTLVAVLTLALGLGANTAIFTLVHAVAFQPLPVSRPHELYRLGDDANCCVNSGLQTDYSLFSYPLYVHLRDRAAEFSGLAAFQANTPLMSVRRAGVDLAESAPSQFVSGNYFQTFGVNAAAGRLFEPRDDARDADPVFVMSHRTWRERFAADPSVVGAAFIVGGTPMTLVGVAAEEFFGDTRRPDPTGLWIPLGQESSMRGPGSIIARADQDWLYSIGRLTPGNTPAGAAAHLGIELRQWLSAQPFVSDQNRGEIPQQHIVLAPASAGVGTLRIAFGQPLTMLFVMSGLVLLIAAANLANLLIAQSDRGQAAVRVALGASTGRLVRQSLTEGVLIALVGGLAGLIVASLSTRAIVALAFPGAGFVPVQVTPSLTVLGFTLILAVITGALFSAAPALAMSRTHPIDALRGAGRSGESRSFVPRRSLVVIQVALSLVLLTAAGLLTESLRRLERQPMGFDPDNRLVVRLDLPASLAGNVDRLSAIYAGLRERLLRIPGVTEATYSLYSPMESNNWSGRISIDGRTEDPARVDGSSWNRVGPRYFETFGTRITRGRSISERDAPNAVRVAVVNEAFVRRFLGEGDPLGRRLGLFGPSHGRDFEIVGVTEDVKYIAASQPVRPMIFLPALQLAPYDTEGERNVQARSTLLRAVSLLSAVPAGELEPQVRRAVSEVDPNLTVMRVVTLASQVSANFRISRLLARLTAAYGLLALALASLGLYAVTSYSVARRTREIGVRMALGADRARVVRHVVWGALGQTSVGLIIGVPAALLSANTLASQLFALNARNPTVLAIAVGVLIASAALAAALPAHRAASVDPTRALRAE